MMNNSFNHTLLQHKQHNVVTHAQTLQQQQQHIQNITTMPTSTTNMLQTTTAPVIGYMQQQQQPQLNQLNAQQYTSAMGSTHSATTEALFDPIQLQTTATNNGLDKTTATYFTTGAPGQPIGNASTRFFTNNGSTQQAAVTTTAATQHPNTILITNNFTQHPLPTLAAQQHQNQQRATALAGVAATNSNNYTSNNIRILSTAAPSTTTLQQHVGMPQPHVYNINHTLSKETAAHQLHAPTDAATATNLHQQLYPQQLLQTQQQLQHFTTQQQQQHHHHLSTLLPQHSAQPLTHFAPQHFAATQTPTHQQHALQLELSPPHAQQYFMPADTAATSTTPTANGKIISTLPALAAGSVAPSVTAAELGIGALTTSTNIPAAAVSATNAVPTTNSTVVLDRINICINNHHYSDASNSAIGAGTIASPVATLSATPAQQPSPIIPAIQHKPIVDTGCGGLLIDTYMSNNSNESTLVIDEPDSTTTTPHTPPTTPENSSPISAQSSAIQSPSTTTTTTKQHTTFETVINLIEDSIATPPPLPVTLVNTTVAMPAAKTCTKFNKIEIEENLLIARAHVKQLPTETSFLNNTVATATTLAVLKPTTPLITPNSPLTPPTPTTPPLAAYSIGEDVFIKRYDGRFYLGTVIDTARQQYLIRFDDKSELWCAADEMRKLGSSSSNSSSDSSKSQTQMCVACKRTQHDDVVEICERCGRGYHRKCTLETAPGSGDWLCKRCAKPMKMPKSSFNKSNVCRQLPYHDDVLNWDEKHRVNHEQIYCYCGKSGKFDHNMLQCCKCQNWFHTQCMQHFHNTNTLLRGDGFFVFCCTVCNDGKEFLRRLQMNWIDVTHLALYNLSALRKHQHHKYHHLIKDIWPFVLEKRHTLPILKEWIEMTALDFKEKIKRTLKENADRFVCGREIKRDPYYYGLRNNGPPILPKFTVQPTAVLTNELLIDTLKLMLLKGAPENESLNLQTSPLKSAIKTQLLPTDHDVDVYEFRIEDDEKFTSDDEIPIKHIIDKAKKHSIALNSEKNIPKLSIKKYSATAIEKMDIDDENANDANGATHQAPVKIKSPSKTEKKQQTPKKDKEVSTPTKAIKQIAGLNAAALGQVVAKSVVEVATAVAEKSSRKRKAFTLSKTYKEIAAEAAAKRYESSRLCDSSSDENSSSSRGTSLDIIIPPPKNFLGLNNPFRIVTPKKHTDGNNVSGGSGNKKSVSFGRGIVGTMIKSSIFNTTALDFSSKLAALKSTGIFPNLSTSNLAKAAGQPRTVRTIKRRLSAKDITIGPNQEVRRRRTRRLSTNVNVEVISTTTINPIPSNFFPIHAKGLLTSTMINAANHKFALQQQQQQNLLTLAASSSSASSSPPASNTSSVDSLPTAAQAATATPDALSQPAIKPTHGRRLRQRPQKISPSNSRRNSTSGASTTSNQSNSSVNAAANLAASAGTDTIMQDLKQSVNKYFGAANRIESGEQFSIRAKRQLANGQMQYLIEWGAVGSTTNANADAAISNNSSSCSSNNNNNDTSKMIAV